jgi:hypothetical protein
MGARLGTEFRGNRFGLSAKGFLPTEDAAVFSAKGLLPREDTSVFSAKGLLPREDTAVFSAKGLLPREDHAGRFLIRIHPWEEQLKHFT